MTAHWGIGDPAAVTGGDIQKEAALAPAFRFLKRRIAVVTNLPLAGMDTMALGATLRDIGQRPGSRFPRPQAG